MYTYIYIYLTHINVSSIRYLCPNLTVPRCSTPTATRFLSPERLPVTVVTMKPLLLIQWLEGKILTGNHDGYNE